MSWLVFNVILTLSIFANNVFTATPAGPVLANLPKVQNINESTITIPRVNDTSTLSKGSMEGKISKEIKVSSEEVNGKNVLSDSSINKTTKVVEQVTSKEAEVEVTTVLSKRNKDTGDKSMGEQADLLNCCVTPSDDDDDDDDVNTDEDVKTSIHLINSTMTTNTTASNNSTTDDNTTTISNITTTDTTTMGTTITMNNTTTNTTSTTLATISDTVVEKNNSLNTDNAEPPQVFPADKNVKSIETADEATIARLNHMTYDIVPSELHNVTEVVTTETSNTNAIYPTEEVEMRNNSVTPMVMQDVQYVGLEEKKKEDNEGMPSGVIALVTATTFAVAIVLAYVTMVVWRQYLEHRYGRRELLVNDLEFDTNDLRHFEL